MTIILYDGECGLCQSSIQFILKRDPNSHFKYASLQSDIGKSILTKVNAPLSIDSLTVVTKGKYLTKSTAVLFICKKLTGWWKLLYLCSIIPKPIRDVFYNIIASNRLRWFGKNEHCPLPSSEDRKKFLSL